ncbi:DUF4136 domain-containing protein [Verticiella sediminum]|nr:DUF4136 domain-containing protein [Verticiella sediminum]
MAGAVLLACAALAGCATTASPFAARVTAFQQWPADAVGQSYRFARQAEAAQGADDLEYRSYEDIIRANLGGIGLVEAQPWDRQPRFTVSFRYGSEPFQTWAEVAAPPPPPMMGYGFYGRRGWGWGMGMGMPFGGWGWGYPGYSGYQAVPVTAYRNILEVSIRDSQRGGAEVYQGRAVHEGRADALPQTMSYLAASIFSNFPQNNGETHTVRIPR